MAKNKKRDLVQIKNPKIGRYVKIDRSVGLILSVKKTAGKYANIPVAGKRSKRKTAG